LQQCCSLVVYYTQITWKYMIQQDEKWSDLRYKNVRLVILVQGFIMKKMAAYHLALWEFKEKASTTFQYLKRTSHFLHVGPCPDLFLETLKLAFPSELGINILIKGNDE